MNSTANNIWEFEQTKWLCIDGVKDFTLSQIKINKEWYDVDSKSIASFLVSVKRHNDSNNCENSNKGLPSEFNFCPNCGEELFNDPETIQWLPPFGSKNGLKYIGDIKLTIKNNNIEIGKSVSLPHNSDEFIFIVSKFNAKKRVLLSIEKQSGNAWVLNPETKKWLQLEESIPSINTFPSWAWSVAANSSEEGILYPAHENLCWVTINWFNNSISYEVLSEARPLGGACSYKNIFIAPVLINETKVEIVSINKSGNKTHNEIEEKTSKLIVDGFSSSIKDHNKNQMYFRVPVIDESKRTIYWISRGGYLKVKVNDNESLEYTYRVWEDDQQPAIALVENGPPFNIQTGPLSERGFWQLCVDHNPNEREGYVYKVIKIDGNIKFDNKIINCGEVLTTGYSSFSVYDDYWNNDLNFSISSSDKTTNFNSNIKIPLLQFGENTILFAKTNSIFNNPSDIEPRFSKLFSEFNQEVFVIFAFEDKDLPDFELNVQDENFPKTMITELVSIRAFIYNKELYIYNGYNNFFAKWKIQIE